MRTMLTVIAGLLIVLSAGAEPQSSVTQIMPKPSQLGAGWTYNHVLMLVDPLCSPSEQVRLLAAVEVMSRSHREAYALVQSRAGYKLTSTFVGVITCTAFYGR